MSPLWLVVVGLFTWILGSSYFPEVVSGISVGASYALGLASVLLLFASILAHEFGHAIVARRQGIEIEEIDLWLLGGVARMKGEAHDPEDELRYAIAGPAVTALVAACFGLAAALLPSSSPAVVRALVEYQAFVNVAILVLNLLPAFPLDGGRVLRSLMWRRSGHAIEATERAANIGRGFGFVMIALGVLETLGGVPEGLWLALIGFFIVAAAGQQAMGARVQATLSGVRVSQLMSSPVVSIPEHTTAQQATSEQFVPYRYTAFPVVDDRGRATGLVSLAQLEQLPARQRGSRWVEEIADSDPDLMVSGEEDAARLLQRAAFLRLGRVVVVDENRRPLGLVSVTDAQRALRASRLRPDDGQHMRAVSQ
jgi:Zn-dependent protease